MRDKIFDLLSDKHSRFNIMVILAITSLILCYIYIKIPIDVEIECLDYNELDSGGTPITVKVEGYVKQSFFRDDVACVKLKIGDEILPKPEHEYIFPYRFSGTVSSNGEVMFKPTDYVESDFISYGQYNWIQLEYRFYKPNEVFPSDDDRLYYGHLYLDKKLDNLIILVYITEKTGETSRSYYHGDNGRIIVSGNTREETDKRYSEFREYIKKRFSRD